MCLQRDRTNPPALGKMEQCAASGQWLTDTLFMTAGTWPCAKFHVPLLLTLVCACIFAMTRLQKSAEYFVQVFGGTSMLIVSKQHCLLLLVTLRSCAAARGGVLLSLARFSCVCVLCGWVFCGGRWKRWVLFLSLFVLLSFFAPSWFSVLACVVS